jgi:hypothetical protein
MQQKLLSTICLVLLCFVPGTTGLAQSNSDLASQGRIRITAEAPISGYKTFTQGDRFNVLISSPNSPATESDLGVDDVQVLHQGQDLLISFRLRPGTTASVRQKLNVVEISIQSTGQASAVKNSSEPVGTSTGLLASKPNGNGNADSAAQPENTIAEASAPANNGSAGNGNGGRALGARTDLAPVSATPFILNEDILKANNLNVVSDEDLAVPESPAFTILGLTPQTVTRPATPKEFASSLLNGVDEHGNFQSGLALDAVPFLVFAGDSVSLYRYNRNYMLRLLSRTQTSFATTKGTGDDDKSIRLALGLHMTVWDKGDPRADDELFACYDRVDQTVQRDVQNFLVTKPGGVKNAEFPGFIESQKAVFTTKTNDCDAEARKRNWKRTGFVIGAAPSWISKTGTTDKFRWNGGGVWASLAYGFEGVNGLKDNSQLIFHVRFRTNEQVPDPATPGNFFTQKSSYFGTRLRLGNPDTNVSFEGVYIRLKRAGEPRDNSYRYSLGFERRIAQNIWFQLALGSDAGRRDSNNQAFVRGTFNWGFTRKQEPTSPSIPSQ